MQFHCSACRRWITAAGALSILVHAFLCRRRLVAMAAAPVTRSVADRPSGRATSEEGREESCRAGGRADWVLRENGRGEGGHWFPAVSDSAVSRVARPPAWISCSSPQSRLLLDANLYWCQSVSPTDRPTDQSYRVVVRSTAPGCSPCTAWRARSPGRRKVCATERGLVSAMTMTTAGWNSGEPAEPGGGSRWPSSIDTLTDRPLLPTRLSLLSIDLLF